MLRIEIKTDSDEETTITSGTYKLNTCISRNIQICEFREKEHFLYEGHVSLDNISDIEIFKYKTEESCMETEHYMEMKLPSEQWRHLWESIIYDEREKYLLFEKILKIESLSELARELFGINKCVLIHGPPGTGKSSLCKAIAQKLAIRRSTTYTLRRIRCSQLFSRFYGESMKILEKVLKSNGKNTILLLDEADSIFMRRESLFSKNEPGDTIRVINTFLTILDQNDHLFIFTTNHKTELDEAFLGRCDVIFEMKCLQHWQVYSLLKGVFEKSYEFQLLEFFQFSEFLSVQLCGNLTDENSLLLFEAARKIVNRSPRQIKKLAFEVLENGNLSISLAIKRFCKLVDDIDLISTN